MTKILSLVFLFSTVISLTTSNAFAFPLPKGNEVLSAELLSTFTPDYNFEGIIKLSNCSGSLVKYETSRETDFAMVLTNGHCLDLGSFLAPGEVVYNQSISRRFGLYNSQSQVVGNLNATHILYGTMTGTDMAIYRVKETYAEIKAAYNVNPLVISSTRGNVSDAIEVISGYWKRGYTCSVEYFVNKLQEDDWTFTESIRYSRPGCETIGGTSGSPIINPLTRQVIGVNNTGNESGELCTMNNPCEVSDDGKQKAYKGVSYGQQVYWIYSCLTSMNEIDLNQEGCLLPH